MINTYDVNKLYMNINVAYVYVDNKYRQYIFGYTWVTIICMGVCMSSGRSQAQDQGRIYGGTEETRERNGRPEGNDGTLRRQRQNKKSHFTQEACLPQSHYRGRFSDIVREREK